MYNREEITPEFYDKLSEPEKRELVQIILEDQMFDCIKRGGGKLVMATEYGGIPTYEELEDIMRPQEERDKMTALLESGFVDTFRYFHPDETGAYSWWSYRFHARENNAGWRIDYFIVSQALTPRLASACIHPEIFGSDHCPVELVLQA